MKKFLKMCVCSVFLCSGCAEPVEPVVDGQVMVPDQDDAGVNSCVLHDNTVSPFSPQPDRIEVCTQLLGQFKMIVDGGDGHCYSLLGDMCPFVPPGSIAYWSVENTTSPFEVSIVQIDIIQGIEWGLNCSAVPYDQVPEIGSWQSVSPTTMGLNTYAFVDPCGNGSSFNLRMKLPK
jgi:uncharacterized cupin superfamily protein